MEIHFEITNQCLLNCRHCSSFASKVNKKMAYSEQNMVHYLNSIEGMKNVFLTGGEPLLYAGLTELLTKIQSEVSEVSLGLFTCGIIKRGNNLRAISKEYSKELVRCGLKVCYLSIYSHEEQIHDWMTRQHGAFSLIMESIKNLQEAGVEIRFNSVVHRKNRFNFEKIVEFAENMNVAEVRMLKLINQGRACEHWDELGLAEEEYREVVNSILERKNKIRLTASGLVDLLPCRYQGELYECPAGEEVFYITYEGAVFPCASVKKKEEWKIGNIYDVDIQKKCSGVSLKKRQEILCS